MRNEKRRAEQCKRKKKLAIVTYDQPIKSRNYFFSGSKCFLMVTKYKVNRCAFGCKNIISYVVGSRMRSEHFA